MTSSHEYKRITYHEDNTSNCRRVMNRLYMSTLGTLAADVELAVAVGAFWTTAAALSAACLQWIINSALFSDGNWTLSALAGKICLWNHYQRVFPIHQTLTCSTTLEAIQPHLSPSGHQGVQGHYCKSVLSPSKGLNMKRLGQMSRQN